MLLVILLALGATTCAAVSTVLKHHSTRRPVPAWAARLPRGVASIVSNPVFALAMVADAAAVGLQVLALRFGDLSVVQPILSAVLLISLALQHLVDRTPVRRAEIGYGLVLVVGLVLFLFASGSVSAEGEAAIGARGPGIVLGVLGVLLVLGAVVGTRRSPGPVRARALGVAVAAIYATTAGLMKSTTHIVSLRGLGAVLLSWQLWVLVIAAAVGLVLGQQAFAAAPLHVSFPVVASLDPLFSVLIGVAVYGERLRTTPLALLGEVGGLALLLLGVARLSRFTADEAHPA